MGAVSTYHADELGQGQLQLDGDELGRAGGRADQVVVAGSVQKVIYKPLLCIGHMAVPWGDTRSDLLGRPCWPLRGEWGRCTGAGGGLPLLPPLPTRMKGSPHPDAVSRNGVLPASLSAPQVYPSILPLPAPSPGHGARPGLFP